MNIFNSKFIGLILISLMSCLNTNRTIENSHPNVLLICVDDLRPELACYGNNQIVSPNIDKLALEGCLFKQHYVQCAICGPSRSTLMTGKIEQGWDIWSDHREKGIEPNQAVSLPHLFRKNGYRTIGIGFWFKLQFFGKIAMCARWCLGRPCSFDSRTNRYDAWMGWYW